MLPFENLSDDKGVAYFADDIQDEILTKLANIADLKVISRTSTAKYKSKPEDRDRLPGRSCPTKPRTISPAPKAAKHRRTPKRKRFNSALERRPRFGVR